jgi:hypothetical protein
MNHSCRAFVVPSLVVAGLLVLGSQTSAASQGTPLWPDFGLHAQAPAFSRQWHGALPIVHGSAGRPAASTYSIDDVGAPNPGLYTSSNPQAFDNNGRMVGYGSTTTRLECVVYNGNFMTLKMPDSYTTCNVTSISDRTDLGNGKYEFVGLAGTQNSENVSAFSSIGGPSKKPDIKLLARFQPSVLNGVNKHGKAIGNSYYSPAGGFFYDQPPFALRGGRLPENFKALQASQCVTLMPLCMMWNSQVDAIQFACGFGGCAINDKGVVLGVDGATEDEMIFPLGNPSGAMDLPFAGPASGGYSAAGINNAGQIAYAQFNGIEGTYLPFIYTVGAAAAVPLGELPLRLNCRRYFPLSENNPGEVLGLALCTSGIVYWTWDSVNGIQNLADLVSLGSTYVGFAPYGVNDNGNILVVLAPTSGPNHWGMLVPATDRARHAIRPHPGVQRTVQRV